MSALHFLEYLPRPRHGTRRRQTRTLWCSAVLAPVITVLLDAKANLAARTLFGRVPSDYLRKEALYVIERTEQRVLDMQGALSDRPHTWP